MSEASHDWSSAVSNTIQSEIKTTCFTQGYERHDIVALFKTCMKNYCKPILSISGSERDSVPSCAAAVHMYRSSRAWIQPSFERIAMHKAKRVQYTWLMRKAVALVIGALTLLSDVGLAFTLPSRVALPATRASHVLYGWGTYGHFRRNQGRCFSSFLYESVACSHRRERHGYYERGKTSSTTVAAMPEKVAEGAGYILGPEVGRCEVEPLPPLRNKYYALRHGQSVANM